MSIARSVHRECLVLDPFAQLVPAVRLDEHAAPRPSATNARSTHRWPSRLDEQRDEVWFVGHDRECEDRVHLAKAPRDAAPHDAFASAEACHRAHVSGLRFSPGRASLRVIGPARAASFDGLCRRRGRPLRSSGEEY